jgi:hypothetical protein
VLLAVVEMLLVNAVLGTDFELPFCAYKRQVFVYPDSTMVEKHVMVP